jgi:NADH dehydrogenase
MTGHTNTHSVTVIGGGYAGVLAANRLQQNPDIDITLINPRPHFVQRLRLHQESAGSRDATADYRRILGDRVRLVVDSAEYIDTAHRTVELASGHGVDYDHLIYAAGSTALLPESIPGAVDFAHSAAEYESAQRLRNAVDVLRPDDRITVVGAGLTGIEVAAEFAVQGRAVTLITDGRVGPSLGAPACCAVTRWLHRRGVGILENTMVTEVGPDAVVLGDGTTLRSDLTVWAGGFGVPGLAARSGLRTDPLGRIITDKTLTSVDDGHVLGAGDAAAPLGRALPMACYTATPMGATAADTVLSRIAGTLPEPFALDFVGSCVGLGRSAVLQFARADNTPRDFHLRGRPFGLFKEAVIRGTVWSLRREARRPGWATWPKGDGSTAFHPLIHTAGESDD